MLRTLLGVIRVAVSLAFVWFSKTAIDCATGRVTAGSHSLILWFSLMVLCMLADVALAQWVKYLESRSNTLMTNSVNSRLFNRLMALPAALTSRGFHSGDMLNRLTLDVRSVSTFLTSQFPSFLVMLVQVAGAFIFLAWLSPYLALAPIVITPLCVVAGKLYFKRQRALSTLIRTAESDIHVSIQESLRHRLVLKSLECLAEVDRRLRSLQGQLDSAACRQARLSVRSSAITRLGFVVGYLVAFGWGIFGLEAGAITFGTMTAFLQLINRVQTPIVSIAGFLPTFITTSVAIDRLQDIDSPLASPSHDDNPQRSEFNHPGVRVKDLTFSYQDDGHRVLANFNHDFTPGSRTMIVGSTGAGKTTLIKLLLGQLSPVKGSVEIYDNHSCQPVSEATLCNFIYVPQGNSLLHGTIRDNLMLASPHATEAEMHRALHTAAADFVLTLPRGLDTPCDEDGGGLSEGQAQRVAIARALLRPGSIMLLDEFNSSLDGDTAATLMQRISEAFPRATIIIIAHHHSAIAPHCDAVLRLDL